MVGENEDVQSSRCEEEGRVDACRGQITKRYLATLGRGNSAKGGDEEIATKRCVEG